jgi:hypothetical protein
MAATKTASTTSVQTRARERLITDRSALAHSPLGPCLRVKQLLSPRIASASSYPCASPPASPTSVRVTFHKTAVSAPLAITAVAVPWRTR